MARSWLDYDALEKHVAEAIGGSDSDYPATLAGVAIRAMHAFFIAQDCWWLECQECGVGHSLDEILPKLPTK